MCYIEEYIIGRERNLKTKRKRKKIMLANFIILKYHYNTINNDCNNYIYLNNYIYNIYIINI